MLQPMYKLIDNYSISLPDSIKISSKPVNLSNTTTPSEPDKKPSTLQSMYQSYFKIINKNNQIFDNRRVDILKYIGDRNKKLNEVGMFKPVYSSEKKRLHKVKEYNFKETFYNNFNQQSADLIDQITTKYSQNIGLINTQVLIANDISFTERFRADTAIDLIQHIIAKYSLFTQEISDSNKIDQVYIDSGSISLDSMSITIDMGPNIDYDDTKISDTPSTVKVYSDVHPELSAVAFAVDNSDIISLDDDDYTMDNEKLSIDMVDDDILSTGDKSNDYYAFDTLNGGYLVNASNFEEFVSKFNVLEEFDI